MVRIHGDGKKEYPHEFELKAIVEAVLYMAGRPVRVDELCEIAEADREDVLNAVDGLRRDLVLRSSALEVVEIPGERFSLQLRVEFGPMVSHLAPGGLFSQAELRTLAFIALKQPVKQSEVAKARGSSVYEHVKELESKGFVESEPFGRTKLLRTTRTFTDSFGLPEDLDSLKQQLLSFTKFQEKEKGDGDFGKAKEIDLALIEESLDSFKDKRGKEVLKVEKEDGERK